MESKINYSTKECYEKLNGVLESFDLTYEDIKKEFEAHRNKQVNTEGYTFAHGRVLSTPAKITPERIQNGSYASDTPSLKAWFERQFRNSSIFNHLGDYDVIDNIQNDPGIQFNAVNGRLFLQGDGNHRLFNYLFLAIIDQKAALSGKEVSDSHDRFTLHNKSVHFEHPKTLIDAFDKHVESSYEGIAQNVKDYIMETFSNSDLEEISQSDYLTFDPATKNYSLYIDGKEYSNISASKATEIIKTQPDLPKGVKIWKANETFYIAADNNVFYSKDNEEFSVIVQNVFNHLSPTAPPYTEDYLVIRNVDEQTKNTTIKTLPKSYSIHTNEELTSDNIIKFKEYLNNNFKSLIDNMSSKDIKTLEAIIQSASKSSIDLPAFEFYGLTEKRTAKIEEILINGLNILNPKKQKEYQQGEED